MARWEKLPTGEGLEAFYWRKELAGMGGRVLIVTQASGDDHWVWQIKGPERESNGYLKQHGRGEEGTPAKAKKAADEKAATLRQPSMA